MWETLCDGAGGFMDRHYSYHGMAEALRQWRWKCRELWDIKRLVEILMNS